MMTITSYRKPWIWIVATVLISVISSTISSTALGQSISATPLEFRIDTDVYVDTSRPPVASTQTLFLQNRVIDWDDGRRRMMRIDLQSQQIELADFASQRRCRVDIGQLASRVAELKSQLSQEQIQAWASAKEPIESEGGYLLESGNLRYRFTAAAPFHPDAAAAYAEFANLSVHVSAIYPPYKPPLLRLQLNEFFSQNSLLPLEIQLMDLRAKSSDYVTARLLVQSALTAQDRERVKDWDVLVQTLKMVSDTEFFQAERNARQKSSVLK
jgi:hypothetical protein